MLRWKGEEKLKSIYYPNTAKYCLWNKSHYFWNFAVVSRFSTLTTDFLSLGYSKDLFVGSLKSIVEWASLLDFSSKRTIWPYQPAFYVNLCTVEHDNSSCTYRDKDTGMKIPRPVMACRSSWYLRDTSVGTVIGYRAKDDVRSGLFVELLHGDRCYNSLTSKWIVYAKLR